MFDQVKYPEQNAIWTSSEPIIATMPSNYYFYVFNYGVGNVATKSGVYEVPFGKTAKDSFDLLKINLEIDHNDVLITAFNKV